MECDQQVPRQIRFIVCASIGRYGRLLNRRIVGFVSYAALTTFRLSYSRTVWWSTVHDLIHYLLPELFHEAIEQIIFVHIVVTRRQRRASRSSGVFPEYDEKDFVKLFPPPGRKSRTRRYLQRSTLPVVDARRECASARFISSPFDARLSCSTSAMSAKVKTHCGLIAAYARLKARRGREHSPPLVLAGHNES